MTIDECIRRYLARCPPSVAGSGGDTQLYKVACGLRRIFGLGTDDLLGWLRVFNTMCCPPWPEHRLAYKAKEAVKNIQVLERGFGRFGRSGDGGSRKKRSPQPVPLLPKAPKGELRTLRTLPSHSSPNARAHTCVRESMAVGPSEASGRLMASEKPGLPRQCSSPTERKVQTAAGTEMADEPLVRYAIALFGPDCKIIETGRSVAS